MALPLLGERVGEQIDGHPVLVSGDAGDGGAMFATGAAAWIEFEGRLEEPPGGGGGKRPEYPVVTAGPDVDTVRRGD